MTPKHADMFSHFVMFLQVAVEGLIRHYKGMRRQTTTCWFAQTVLSPRWCETADHRNTAPESARRWRKTSAAGELQSLSVFLWSPAQDFFMTGYCTPHSSSPPVYLHISVVHHLLISLLTTSCVFLQGFQLSKAQQEMPLASLWPFHPWCAEAGQRQLYFVWKKR